MKDFLTGRGGAGCIWRRACEAESLSFFLLERPACPSSCTLVVRYSDNSLVTSLPVSLGLICLAFLSLPISYPGTRLASWLYPSRWTWDPKLSVSKRSSTMGKPWGWEHVRREIQTQKWKRKTRGGEDLYRLFFFLFTDFYYWFDCLNFYFYYFSFDIWTKNTSPFLANDCDFISSHHAGTRVLL